VALADLDEADLKRPRPAFFGSIHGTVNHLLVADRIWLERIKGERPAGWRLNDQPYGDFASLDRAREREDLGIIALLDEADEAEIGREIVYQPITTPEAMRLSCHLCWLHLFNHQTHHRGQIHDMLSQTEVAPPPLDLIYYIREAG